MEQETEKLTIDERKIIDILLKQLMNIQNEFAYFKNKTGLQMLSGGISDLDDGSKPLFGGISDLGDGSKPLLGSLIDLGDGSKPLFRDTTYLDDGSKTSFRGIADLDDGSKPLSGSIADLDDGSKPSSGSIADLDDGSKPLFTGISVNGNENKGDFWLYSVFEKELIIALKQYINNANGQNSLFDFYTDFEQAVAEKNAAVAKMKEAKIIFKLEDTHILPAEITVDNVSVLKLSNALREYLALNAPRDLKNKMARELLYLHNFGKATTTQLREFTRQSVGGISKHLPKMRRTGFIKKQPPLNYALTEKSEHILLETFGIPKS